jgi:hypothetical protein
MQKGWMYLVAILDWYSRYVVSCQDFAQKGPCLTLVQDHFEVTGGQQRAKARAHIASPGMCTSQADALHAFVRQLHAPRNRPHLLDQPYDAILLEPWCVLSEPLSCPQQDIVGQLNQQHDQDLAQAAGVCE